MELKEKEDLRDNLIIFLSTIQTEIIDEKNKPQKNGILMIRIQKENQIR